MSIISVFIVDDNFVARRGLRSVLEAEKDIEVAGEASSGREVIEKLKKTEADVVLMDVRMPEIDGIAATAELVRLNPRLRVLLVTVNEDPSVHMQALLAGASGYLVYGHFSADELAGAVRRLAAGERVSIPQVSQPLAIADSEENGELTQREGEILRLIAVGKDNREIAAALAIEEKTVKNHINSIYSKIGATNRRNAIYYMLSKQIRR